MHLQMYYCGHDDLFTSECQGNKLSSFTGTSGEIIALYTWHKDKKACLLCMEADPLQCHRRNEIGKRIRRYGVIVEHISGEAKDEGE